nr:GAS2 protein 3 [Hymenolepis microstoma]
MSTTYHCPNILRGSNFYGGSVGDLRGVTSPFVQVLDESMCVIREDICDWLQRYVFSDADVLPLNDPADLLERLKSGVWLARLAYKLHFKVLAENLPQCSRGVKVTSKEHKLYASLRGTGPSNALGQLTSKNLPEFSTALTRAARSCLSECDTAIGGFAPPSNLQTISPANSTVPSESGVVLRNRWTARGNISEFLKWCHDLGISETVLFETNGLVYRTEEKNVLLTLMDLARLASRFGLCELPELVRMEKEIEALEAAAAASNTNATTRTPTATGTMTSYSPKVDIGVYAARLADRKASDCSPERYSISSDVDVPSSSSSIGSAVSTDPAARYCSNAAFTATEVLLTDLEDEGKSSQVRSKIDSSTVVNTSDSAADAFCQTNTNKPEMISSGANAENNPNNSSSTSVETDNSSIVTDSSVTASLPPRKFQQVSTSNIKPRATASKLPVHQSRVSGNKSVSNGITKVEVAKRSTSAADLRELSKSRVKRRNIRQNKAGAFSAMLYF